MQAVGAYIVSVTAAAVISAIVLRLLEGKGPAAAYAKILAALFVAFTVISPLSKVRLSDLTSVIPDVSLHAKEAVAYGQMQTENALRQSISKRLEAYILEKAAQLGVTITVEVELSDDPIPQPIRVRLHGNVAPYTKLKLQNMIRDDLGISKENQIWT